ncbi:MAG: hypothetical protein AAF799_28420 [Myxococcota bacterium]
MQGLLFLVAMIGLGIGLVAGIRRLVRRQRDNAPWLAVLLLGGGIALTTMCILGRAIGLSNPLWLNALAVLVGCSSALAGIALLEANAKRRR